MTLSDMDVAEQPITTLDIRTLNTYPTRSSNRACRSAPMTTGAGASKCTLQDSQQDDVNYTSKSCQERQLVMV
eukprot:m.39393 g.39393  ORF g.39393 m.39393 type:complete len:73 (-) comp14709_c0_seq1:41-259(-)